MRCTGCYNIYVCLHIVRGGAYGFSLMVWRKKRRSLGFTVRFLFCFMTVSTVQVDTYMYYICHLFPPGLRTGLFANDCADMLDMFLSQRTAVLHLCYDWLGSSI